MKLRRVAIVLLWILVTAPARADQSTAPSVHEVVGACVAAAERAQIARDERRLLEARQELLTCSAPACPLVVRKDCASWLEQVGARLPGIVVSVRDEEDHDLVDVQIDVDGKPFASKLDGKLLFIDPGEHVFRYEPAGHAPFEERVLVREGETHRLLTARLRRRVPLVTQEEPRERPRPVPTLSLALAGVGLAGIGGFALFAGGAKSDLEDLRATCGRSQICAESDVDSVRQRLVVANVALGIGVVALAGAAWMYFARRESK